MKYFRYGLVLLAAVAFYLATFPVDIDPVAWDAKPNPGYTGPFQPNDQLVKATKLPLPGAGGPEAVAPGPDGAVYVATSDGWIWRIADAKTAPARWVEVGGKPLGLEFAPSGDLYVADATRGLLRVSADKKVTLVADKADGQPIVYADDVDVAPNGLVYFTDASTKFSPVTYGGTLPASVAEILEHGGTGRLLIYDPASGQTQTVLKGLTFPNGVAVSADGSFLLLAVTGDYKILKLFLTGPKAGSVDTLIDNLPGFPDNVQRDPDGTFWFGLVSPRSAAADALASKPFWRKVVRRLPAALQPKAQYYGFIVHIDGNGRILETLQDPSGSIFLTTGALSAHGGLYISSLGTPFLARIDVR